MPSEVAPSSETTALSVVPISAATSPRRAGLTAMTIRSADSASAAFDSIASPSTSRANSAARPDPESVNSIRSNEPAHPRAIAAAMFPDPTNPTIIAGRLRQDWLKNPLSINRAFSSAETSTLRGVRRKTFSAIRCIPPSIA